MSTSAVTHKQKQEEHSHIVSWNINNDPFKIHKYIFNFYTSLLSNDHFWKKKRWYTCWLQLKVKCAKLSLKEVIHHFHLTSRLRKNENTKLKIHARLSFSVKMTKIKEDHFRWFINSILFTQKSQTLSADVATAQRYKDLSVGTNT